MLFLTRIFELDRGGLTEYQGNYQDYVRLKAEQDERDAALLHKKEQLYKQELAWMRRQPQARATKQQARINRSMTWKRKFQILALRQTWAWILKLAVSVKKLSSLRMFPLPMTINRFWNILIFWSKPKTVSESSGDNGVGKSTLLNLISGRLEATEGQVIIGETVRIAYFSQQNRRFRWK